MTARSNPNPPSTRGRATTAVVIAIAIVGGIALWARAGLVGLPAGPEAAADPTPRPSAVILQTDSPTEAGASAAPTTGPSAEPPTFSDEFDGDEIQDLWVRTWERIGQTTWSRDQASVENGILTIRAERRGDRWVSYEMDTVGTFAQMYGRFAARVKAPAGAGLWPTFWIAEGWRVSHAEIDIMEICANPPGTHDGNDQTILHNFIHDVDGVHTAEQHLEAANVTGEWHEYVLEWRRDLVEISVDGEVLWTVTDEAKIPDVPMSVVLDLAVGGWCGPPDDTTPSPSDLQVDWVRVWR